MTTLAFVCVGNAGRSQLATAFADQERTKRGPGETVDIVTGDNLDAVRAQRDEIRRRVAGRVDRTDLPNE